jgi:D-alanyl-D-alanine carboxypeptidase (penicillin-binding protein 5/6)
MVLLAMLMLAIVVGVGAKGFDALTESSDATTFPPTSSIDAPQLTPNAANAAQQANPTVAPFAPTAEPTGTAETEQPDATTTVTHQSPPPAGDGSEPGGDVTARAAYAYDVASQSVLYQLNENKQMPVGSIVKVVTALVTVEHVALDEVVTIDGSDLVDPAIYSNMALIEGDRLTVEQLLQGLLIPSGGDAAQALARYVGGQLSGSDEPAKARSAFVAEMNAYVESLGLEHTHFANATGDEADDNYSSAADVAVLGAQLMQNDALAEIVAMPSYDFVSAGGNEYTLPTTNELLGSDGIVGIKTGSTGEAGGCVVLAQQRADGSLVILTILGSDLEYDDLNRIIADARWDDAREVLQTIDGGSS